MMGLTLFDFQARRLDYSYNSFTTRDPLEEKYYSISQYAYCLNNPLRFIDPDGKQVLYGEKAQNAFRSIQLMFAGKEDNISNEEENNSSKKYSSYVDAFYLAVQYCASSALSLFAQKEVIKDPITDKTIGVSYKEREWTPDYVSLDVSVTGIVIPVSPTGPLVGGGLFLSAAYTKGSGFSLLGGYKIGAGFDLSADVGASMGFYRGNATPNTMSLTGWGTFGNVGYSYFTGGASQNLNYTINRHQIGNQWLINSFSIGVGLPVSLGFGVNRTFLLWP